MAQRGRHSAEFGALEQPAQSGKEAGLGAVAASGKQQVQGSGYGYANWQKQQQRTASGYGYAQNAQRQQNAQGSGYGYAQNAQRQQNAQGSGYGYARKSQVGQGAQGSGYGYARQAQGSGYGYARQSQGQQHAQNGYGYTYATRSGNQRTVQQPYAGKQAAQGASGQYSRGAHGAHSEAAFYSRGNYGPNSAGKSAHKAPKKRMGAGKRVAIVIGCILAALLLLVGGFILWFALTLNAELAPPESERDALKSALADTPIDKPLYVLVLGSDSREGSGTSSNLSQSGDQERSDVIMLARLDAANKAVTLVTVPRDTPYTLPDGQVVKVNEMYNIGGAAASIKAVSEITGQPITHYVEVHISELEAIVDAVGGVEVEVDRDLEVKDTLTGEQISIKAGKQTLNGRQAQVFARARHMYDDDQDGHRQSNVRALTVALVKKALSRPVYEIPGTILNVAQYVTSDLDTGSLASIARAFSGGNVHMYSCTGPSDGQEMSGLGGLWMCYPNPEGWAELMRQVNTGGQPGEIDFAATQIIPEYA